MCNSLIIKKSCPPHRNVFACCPDSSLKANRCLWECLAIGSIAIVLIFGYNFIVPFYGDDIFSQFHIETGKYMTSFSEVFDSAICSWNLYTGRFIPAIFMPLVVTWLGDTAFNILNTIIIVLNLVFACKLAIGKVTPLSLLLATTFFFILGNGDMLVNAALSVNYMWTFACVMVFLLLMRKFTASPLMKFGVMRYPLLFLVGILLGMQHEMFCFVVGGVLVGLAFTQRRFKAADSEIVPLKNGCTKSLSFGWLSGALIVLSSPTLISRAAIDEDISVMMILHHLMNPLLSSWFLFLTALVLWVCQKFVGNKVFHFWLRKSMFLFMAIFLGLVPSLVSGESSRAIFASNVFAMVLLVRMLCYVCYYYSNSRIYVKSIAVGIFGIVSAYLCVVMCYDAAKWQTYRYVTGTYLFKPDMQVYYHYARLPWIVNLYTEDLGSLLYRRQTVTRLQELKRQVTWRDSRARKMLAIPNNLGSLFYLLPYNDYKAEMIGQGRMYALYTIDYLPGILLKVNYTVGDVLSPRPFLVYHDNDSRKWILLNKNYKHFPWTTFQRLGINRGRVGVKFEILKNEG
ncbi:putative membrane protein [Prevotella sp. MSX73]|nr:putative membrane protein [Prevotella sp. MSX73]